MDKTRYNAGSEIRIPCEVEGYPTPAVNWYLNDVQIDLVTTTRRHRYGNSLDTTSSSPSFQNETHD